MPQQALISLCCPIAKPLCPEHADFSFLTISMASRVPELEIFDRKDFCWRRVEEGADEMDAVIFAGSYLARITCGYVYASLHRVLRVRDGQRTSMPFFLRGNPETLLQSAPLFQRMCKHPRGSAHCCADPVTICDYAKSVQGLPISTAFLEAHMTTSANCQGDTHQG